MIDAIGDRTLPDLLAERVAAHPDKPWLIFEDRGGQVTTFTYRQFLDLVERAAAGFAELGVDRGEAVVLHLRNCPELLVS